MEDFGSDNAKLEIKCPWCKKKQFINAMSNNMIMAFNCKHCDEPIVVIQEKPLKIDKKILETGDIIKLQEYILDLLDKEFNISAEINKVEQLKDPFCETDINEKKETEEHFAIRGPISEEEIKHMKDFLESYKIPRNGNMFEE